MPQHSRVMHAEGLANGPSAFARFQPPTCFLMLMFSKLGLRPELHAAGSGGFPAPAQRARMRLRSSAASADRNAMMPHPISVVRSR